MWRSILKGNISIDKGSCKTRKRGSSGSSPLMRDGSNRSKGLRSIDKIPFNGHTYFWLYINIILSKHWKHDEGQIRKPLRKHPNMIMESFFYE